MPRRISLVDIAQTFDGRNGAAAIINIVRSRRSDHRHRIVPHASKGSGPTLVLAQRVRCMMFELTQQDGKPITINPANLLCFQSSNTGTMLIMTGDVRLLVTESYDAVAEMFNPERQAVEIA